MKIDWVLITLIAGLVFPLVGAYQHIATENAAWLLLMLPLAIWMEGMFVLAPVLYFVAILVHWILAYGN